VKKRLSFISREDELLIEEIYDRIITLLDEYRICLYGG